MKKFFGILAIAAVFASCDNSASSEKRTKDSMDSVKTADSISKANATTPVTPPTTSPSDSGATMTMPTDSSSMKMGGDSTKK